MKKLQEKLNRKVRRKRRIRGKVSGTADRPRLSVYKSNQHLYVQVIDDVKGETLMTVSTLSGETKGLKPNVEDAAKVGKTLAAALKKKKITRAVFDRNGNLYHGVIRSLADGTREAGIEL